MDIALLPAFFLGLPDHADVFQLADVLRSEVSPAVSPPLAVDPLSQRISFRRQIFLRHTTAAVFFRIALGIFVAGLPALLLHLPHHADAFQRFGLLYCEKALFSARLLVGDPGAQMKPVLCPVSHRYTQVSLRPVIVFCTPVSLLPEILCDIPADVQTA